MSAHHGWPAYDTAQPLFISGTIEQLEWVNPHVEIQLAVPSSVQIPDDLANLALPQELESLGYRETLRNVIVPSNSEKIWQLEMAPISRLRRWGLAEPPQVGSRISVIGYQSCTDPDEIRPELIILENNQLVRQRSVSLPESSCASEAINSDSTAQLNS